MSATIGARLRDVARRLPDRLAVCARGERISYARLDADATAIASSIVAAAGGRAGTATLLSTMKAFEDALRRHRPLPYDGPVYVLSSRDRIEDPLALRSLFTGRFKRYYVGGSHAEALDPRNPVFAQTLLRCVALIREAAPATVA